MPDFSSLAHKWPSSLVSRDKISDFTGGIISHRYLANLDSRGVGPKGRQRVGRKVVYEVKEVVKWLEQRARPR